MGLNSCGILYGEDNPTSILTELQVKDIINKLSQGMSQKRIANIYGVHRTTISKINTGKYWSHLKL